VSLGPGARPFIIPEALQALAAAEVLVGYQTYLALIGDLQTGKRVIASGMRKEVERCQDAIDQALAGNRVALVSSGDAGIYGMAGLVLDICRERHLTVKKSGHCGQPAEKARGKRETGAHRADPGAAAEGEVDLFLEIIPGVAAFNAAASLLGAPLMHDFAAVSLSDHLTPWELIEQRLDAAAAADFVIALYNPRSKMRPDLLERAREILLRHRSGDTPVGIVRQAMREGQWQTIATLAAIPFPEVDMQSILLVGNSRTYVWEGWMVTPRGYLDKYTLEPGTDRAAVRAATKD
jgi:precorrin-3B C17-methyltransferase